jgi:signal transduction histidine kinase
MTGTSRRAATPVVRVVLAATVLVIAAYVVWTLPGVRPRPGFQKWFDGLLQGSGYVLAAVLALLGTGRRRTAPAWWCVVAAVTLRAVGFAIALTGLSLGRVPSYPSAADAAWVASGIALFVALALRLRELSPRLTRLVVLDGASTALIAAGVAVNVLSGPLRTLTEPGVPHSAIVMNLVYPTIDVALLVVTAALVAVRFRLTRADLVLLIGVVGFVAVDVAYFVLLAEGLWRPGTLIAAFSLVTTVVIGGAVATSRAPIQERPRRPGDVPDAELTTGVVVPAALIGFLLVVLALSGLAFPAVAPALLLYGVGGVVAITRGVLTVRKVQAEATRYVGEASSDLRLFKALVDASEDFIGMADDRARPLYVNPSGLRMLHLPEHTDVTALDIGKLAPGATPDEFPRRWEALLREGTWSGQTELVPVDGSPGVPVDISTFVVQTADVSGRRVAGTIQRDISERLRAERALQDLADQRARLLQRLVQAEEDERARIAHDVHDDPVQALAAVDLRLGLLRRRLSEKAPDVVDDVEVVQSIVADATGRLRNLLFNLESLPEDTTLADAITEAAEFIFAGSEVRHRVVGDPDLPLPQAHRVTAHRIVKEALVNVSKHAGASNVEVRLERAGEAAVLTVDDDGRGLDPGADRWRPGHLGLAAMRDRAQVAGGALEVDRRAEGGTRVRLTLPLT